MTIVEHGEMNEYQFQPPCVGFIPQVLLETEAVHILIDDTEWMCFSVEDPHERHYIHVSVVKEDTHANLVAKSLRGISRAGLGM